MVACSGGCRRALGGIDELEESGYDFSILTVLPLVSPQPQQQPRRLIISDPNEDNKDNNNNNDQDESARLPVAVSQTRKKRQKKKGKIFSRDASVITCPWTQNREGMSQSSCIML